MKFLSSLIVMTIFVSCIEPEKNGSSKKKSKGKEPIGEVALKESQTNSDIAMKNFLQVKNTFSQLTEISPNEGNINDEFQAIQLQLPSTTDPGAYSGFNSLASIRLAFAFCEEYVDQNASKFDFSTGETNRAELKSMALEFVDLDFENNNEHADFLANLEAIANDDDDLVDDGNFSREKRKLIKMSCAGILASTYVTML